MEDGKERAVPMVMVMQQDPMDETEISFSNLWGVVCRRKFIVSIVVFFAVAAGLAYALLTPSVYKAEAFLVPPTEAELQGLRMGNSPAVVSEVYNLFIKNLESHSLRKQYFDEYKLANRLAPNQVSQESAIKIFERAFNNALSVHQDRVGAAATVSFEGPDARLAAEWVNGLVAQANAATKKIMIQRAMDRLAEEKQAAKKRLNAHIELAKTLQNTKIEGLERAVRVAERLGLHEIIAAEPLYMRGTKALRVELEEVRRSNDFDSYVPELKKMRAEVAYYEGLRIDPASISAIRVEQAAIEPIQSIRPKRVRIALLALFGGLLLGLLAAAFAEFLTTRRGDEGAKSEAEMAG